MLDNRERKNNLKKMLLAQAHTSFTSNLMRKGKGTFDMPKKVEYLI